MGVQKTISGVQKRGCQVRKLQREEPYVEIPMEKALKDEESRKRNESKKTGESSSVKNPPNIMDPTKPPVGRKLFPDENITQKVQKEQAKEEEMLTDDFESDRVSSVNMNCNVVSVLPHKYNQETKVEDNEEADAAEMAKHQPVCYYVLNSGVVEEQNAMFERPHQGMQSHLKPLYIRAKVGQVGVNKVLVDRGAVVNLMPQFMLKKIGMFDTDVKPHNMVLSNYEGKIGQTLGVI